jgi:hypothetical protein
MKKVKMHQGCLGQEMVATGESAPPAPKCRCKKMVEYAYANELIKTNQAKWVVVKRTPVEVIEDCSFCEAMTDVEKKNCALCAGSGKVNGLREIETYNNDIVLMSQMSVDVKNKKYRRNTRAKTPRVATIEKKHIIRAFVDDLKYAVERIKEYEVMIQESLAWFGPLNRCLMGARLRTEKTGEVLTPGLSEPKDEVKSYPPGSITFSDGTKNKSWYWKVEGRRFDYGRTI